MNALKVVEVVKEIVHFLFQNNENDIRSPKLKKALIEKGFSEDLIEKAIEFISTRSEVSVNCNYCENSTFRSMSEVERKYLSRELQSFLWELRRQNIISQGQMEDLINFLIAIANKPLTLQDVKDLLKEFLIEDRKKMEIWFLLNEKFFMENKERRMRVH